jgi:adenylate cyclase
MVSSVESVDEHTHVTILFADVVGSTQLYELMGDDLARETIQACVEIMRKATDEFGGSVIKTMGDEVMSTFLSANDAIGAASQMQQQITNNPEIGSDGVSVSIRIGCHFGSVVTENRDVFGAAVQTANRMTSQAKAGQIITTEATVDRLSGQWQALVRQIDLATVRGQSDEIAVFEVLWQPEEATRMDLPIDYRDPSSQSPNKLHLRRGNEEIVLAKDELTSITLGRGNENDLVVKGRLISRLHARIELVKNRFMLVDESTNGTFVQQNGGERIYVRRDSAELFGSGVISLGRAVDEDADVAVEYSCES